jgi:hypothetical protein
MHQLHDFSSLSPQSSGSSSGSGSEHHDDNGKNAFIEDGSGMEGESFFSAFYAFFFIVLKDDDAIMVYYYEKLIKTWVSFLVRLDHSVGNLIGFDLAVKCRESSE